MRLLERHCSTVRHEMTEAVGSYDEKPRDQWLFDFPAQVALCGTQIWWTTEVNIAFGRLEEGYENALKDYNKKQVHFTITKHVMCLSAAECFCFNLSVKRLYTCLLHDMSLQHIILVNTRFPPLDCLCYFRHKSK